MSERLTVYISLVPVKFDYRIFKLREQLEIDCVIDGIIYGPKRKLRIGIGKSDGSWWIHNTERWVNAKESCIMYVPQTIAEIYGLPELPYARHGRVEDW